MRILFIAPLPYPINGQSKASNMVLESLGTDNEINIIDLSKKSLKSGFSSLSRGLKILNILIQVWKNRKQNDIIYISIAESIAGNLRDLFIYFICFSSKNKIVIHMLGGAGMTKILNKGSILSTLNKYFISKFGAVIVEGDLNFQLFSKIISEDKVHIIPNFADDYLFVSEEEIKNKFHDLNTVNILFLSNLISGKGYLELAEAYIGLPDLFKNKIFINFVGGFESENAKIEFLSKIEDFDNLNYVGAFIDGIPKKELYNWAHILCLPTYYPFEGQPISILEAYASGCAVITTNHSGIPFIFSDSINGFSVEKASVKSLIKVLEKVVYQRDELLGYAKNNRHEAYEKYRASIFRNNAINVFLNLHNYAKTE